MGLKAARRQKRLWLGPANPTLVPAADCGSISEHRLLLVLARGEENVDALRITMSEMHGQRRPDLAKQTSRRADADNGSAEGAKLVPAPR